MKNKQILLTWDAFNNGFIVTATAIKQLAEDHSIVIDEIVYLQTQKLQPSNLAEIDAFSTKKINSKELNSFSDEKIQKRIKDCYKISCDLSIIPKFTNKNINITNVVDYQMIYDLLIDFLNNEFGKQRNYTLHINVSPGTPQMHVVWLMLNSAGFLPSDTVLWSSQWVRERNTTTLTKIEFKPKTFLSEVLKSNYLQSNLPKINPNETKSKKRQEAENTIDLFSHIPNAPILLLGERGTGKSTYVRTLIKNKQDKDLPYKELACGIFSEELMRSELFGYEKGAFTGATEKKTGFLADFKQGGILFLDEIHDLSKPLQRQLMQVLQTGEYYPIGATKPEKSIFKLVTASNLDFNDLATNKLDADFFDRISRFIVEIPALRNSKEDLELYWKETWKQVANFEAAPKIIWNNELADFLVKADLSGNFRDLQKIASYVMVYFLQTKKIDNSVSQGIKEYLKWKNKLENKKEQTFFKLNETHETMVAHFEKAMTEWAIKEYGNKKEAARILKRTEGMLNKYLNLNRLK